MTQIIPFTDLADADLVVDAVYEGGLTSDIREEPLTKLLKCGNQGGFRKVVGDTGGQAKYVVLYSSLEDRDWPDGLDLATGLFVYYGDNKKPGRHLHETRPGGNELLNAVFADIHATPARRSDVPPFFVFTKSATPSSQRSAQFRGLAAPGGIGIAPTDDLVALWKASQGKRFQNYRSVFTVLDVAVISRAWIEDLRAGNPLSANCPKAWRIWVNKGKYTPLRAEPTVMHRSVEDQLPRTPLERDIVCTIFRYFENNPTGFEYCAAKLAQMMDDHIIIDEVTRAVIDGGRDAIGRYQVGPRSDPVEMEFALEAKCYSPGVGGLPLTTAGVRETSRLISRLRHRQFGILVTTAVLGKQAYEEIRQDRHPVIILCGRDIAQILIGKGINSADAVHAWLAVEFPQPSAV